VSLGAPQAQPPEGVTLGSPTPPQQPPPQTQQPPQPIHEGMVDHYLKNAAWWDPVAGGVNLMAGAGAGVEQTAAGLDKIARKVTGHEGEDWLQREAAKPTEGTYQAIGKGGEAVGEFFGGEEILSMLGRAGMALSGAEKLKLGGQVASIVNKVPMLGKLLRIGAETVKSGAVAGGQEYAKTGGDSGAAADTGMLTGGLTAGLGLTGEVAAAAGRGLIKLAPGARTMEGAIIPYLQSQVNKAGKFIEGGDISEIAPKIAADQQAAAQQVIKNVAARATGKVLDILNDSRQYLSRLSPQAAESVPESTSPFRFELSAKPKITAPTEAEAAAAEAQSAADQKTLDTLGDKRAEGKLTAAEQQQWQQAWDRESGQARTTPSLAQATRAHSDLHDLYMSDEFDQMSKADQNAITEVRDRLRDQIDMHHASSRFDPINTADMVANTDTFGHTADHIEGTIQPVIAKMDQVSKGAIVAAQRAVATASDAVRNARSVDAFKDATKALTDRQQDLTGLLNRYSSAVSGADFDAVNKAMPYVQQFRSLHSTFEHMMNGVTWEEATKDGLSRVMTGSARNFQDWLDNPANSKMLDDMVGRDSRVNLKQLTQLMSKVQPQRHMAEAAKNISAIIDAIPSLRGHTAGAGVLGLLLHGAGVSPEGIATLAAGAAGTRYVIRQAATNPNVGRMLTYAVTHGVAPDVYAPLIARTIAEPMRDQGQQPAADQTEQQPGESPPQTMVTPNPKGLIEAGNLDIRNRPVVQNADGTHSSEYSISIGDDKGREVLIPTVVGGKFLTPDGTKPPEGSAAEKQMFKRAADHYRQTGEHLGIFDNPDDADAYAQILHNRGEK
jgi:hypothetical protein